MTQKIWTPAYIGIGSNLDDPQKQVARGVDALKTIPMTQVVLCSKQYRTPPFGPQDQPHYVNAVAGLLTQLDAAALLAHLKALEKKLGKTEPVVRWGARVIDFDLLVLGAERIDSTELKLPHPGIAERASVLVPLAEIAPHLDVPGVGRPVSLVKRVDTQDVEAL